jgi:hypothetical protein
LTVGLLDSLSSKGSALRRGDFIFRDGQQQLDAAKELLLAIPHAYAQQ